MGVLEKLELREDDNVIEGTNRDMLPTPPHERTWAWWMYVCTWAGPSFDINQWNTGSSFITIGLTVSQATAPVMLGSLIATLGIVFMGLPGAKYHVGFPSLVRPTFGTSASKIIVGLRGLVGVIWYGIEAYYVSTMVNIMLRCIIGDKWYKWNPTMPSSAGTSAQVLISFFLTWALIFPLVFVHPKKMDRTFLARMIFGPIAYIVLFAWCAHLGYSSPGGFQGFSNIESKISLKGSALGWAIISCVNSVMGTISPQTTNVSDITRYARSSKEVGWQQGVGFWVTKVISIFLAIFSASFLYSRFGGTVIWNVWDQLDLILTEQWGPASRAGVFFIALGFAFSSTVTNAYANTVPFGADISCLLPTYFDMRRGQILIAMLSLCTLPWRLFTSGAAFLNFLGSYSFFMASVAGPIFVDYFIIRRANYHVSSFYRRGNPSDIYTYNKYGANWRGLAAFASGVIVILPGLISSYNGFSVTASKMYSTGWVISACVSASVYFTLCKISPVKVLPDGNDELAQTLRYGQMGETDGLLPHEYSRGLDAGLIGDDVESTDQNEKKIDDIVFVREV